jgi:toxin ParE1/3/4
VKLVVTPMAQADFIDIARYIAGVTGDGARGVAFARKLRAQCEKIADLPGMLGRPRPELGTGLRSFPFTNWLIVFRYGDDLIEIARVLGGQQDIEAAFRDDLDS